MNNCRVLIVEDDPVNISLLSGLMVGRYQISIARTKQRALDILQNEEIGIVLLDLHLPDGNGMDICKMLKLTNKRDDAPIVIVMTGTQEPSVEAQCLLAGASDFMVKPLNVEVFNARLEIQAQRLQRN